MSICNAVVLDWRKMPTPKVWAAAIKQHGFDVDLDPDFDVETHSGFLPCAHDGHRAGFEYFRESIEDAELEDAELAKAAGRDTIISFVTHSDERGLVTAVVASTVLASIADGVHWDQEANEFHSAAEALAWGRELEDSLRIELNTPPPKPASAVSEVAQPVSANVRAQVAFRGASLLMLETCEAPPRRFTVKLDTSALPVMSEVEITGLWERAGLEPIVRTLRIGAVVREFDAKGAVSAEPDITSLIASLGRSDAAIQGLLAARARAVPDLVKLVSDPNAPAHVRQLAMVILGQLGADASAAIEPLSKLTSDAVLGPAAERAFERIKAAK